MPKSENTLISKYKYNFELHSSFGSSSSYDDVLLHHLSWGPCISVMTTSTACFSAFLGGRGQVRKLTRSPSFKTYSPSILWNKREISVPENSHRTLERRSGEQERLVALIRLHPPPPLILCRLPKNKQTNKQAQTKNKEKRESKRKGEKWRGGGREGGRERAVSSGNTF